MRFFTFEQYKQHYFPQEYERIKIEKMTPEEYGRYLVGNVFDRARKTMSSIDSKI